MRNARPTSFRRVTQLILGPWIFARLSAGRRRAITITMVADTTSNSNIVKAPLACGFERICACFITSRLGLHPLPLAPLRAGEGGGRRRRRLDGGQDQIHDGGGVAAGQ